MKFPSTPESVERLFVQEFSPDGVEVTSYHLLGRDKDTGEYLNFFWDGVSKSWNEMNTVISKSSML